MRSCCLFAALLAVSVGFATVAGAEQTGIGTTAAVNVDTKGTPPSMATRTLYIGANVFSRERIETSKTGQAQLLFLDESALTIASDSDVVLDRFIYDPATSPVKVSGTAVASYLKALEGRTGAAAGAGDPPSDDDVANSGIDGLGSSNDPGSDGGDTTPQASHIVTGIEDIVDITDGREQTTTPK